jgi:hypothetical protein
MSTVAQQVSTFVKASEALHWALLEGHALTIEDRDMIQQTAIQLLMRAEGSTHTRRRPQTPSNDKGWTRWEVPLDDEAHP